MCDLAFRNKRAIDIVSRRDKNALFPDIDDKNKTECTKPFKNTDGRKELQEHLNLI